MTCGTKDGKPHLYTPLRAIRRKCLDCCAGSSPEVALCHIKDCSLWPYRDGHNPRKKGQGGPGNREALAKYFREKKTSLTTDAEAQDKN